MSEKTYQNELLIEGMSCASCVNRVEKALLKIPEVQEAQVNLAMGRARIQSRNPVAYKELARAVTEAGYKPAPLNTKAAAQESSWRIYLALALSFPLVLPMILMLFQIHWELSPLWQLVLATPVQFWLGARFYRGAWSAVKNKAGNMDLLVVIGTSAAFGLSLYHLFVFGSSAGGEDSPLYFESAAVVISLVLLGKHFESRATRKTGEALRALQKLRPTSATVFREGKQLQIPLSDLKLSDEVLIRPGEQIPVDAVILEGQSHLDESLMTGESIPLAKGPQDKILGGATNGEGVLKVKPLSLAGEGALARIIELVENAQMTKAPIQKLVDRVSAVFVPTILVLALITLFSWGFITGDWQKGIMASITLLVIACPCALGLATPTALMVGTGLAAREGILIRDPEALELAQAINTVAFDKTGTLTLGRPELSVIEVFSDAMTGERVLSLAASLQAQSEHPLAKAILTKAQKESLSFVTASQTRSLAGRGFKGVVEGRKIFIGNELLCHEKALDLKSAQERLMPARNAGASISYLFEENESGLHLLAGFAFMDQLRPQSKEAVQGLRELGIHTVILSGDHQAAAQRIAHELGIDEVRAPLLPEQKSQVIRELQEKKQIVAMVGDGVNDAPALAAADIGIAMASGTDVAMHTAGITLLRNDPRLVSAAIDISRKTYRKFKQNLFWAFFYNVIGIPLAAFGYVTPMIAGTAMALSSISVVSNSLLLNRSRKNKTTSEET